MIFKEASWESSRSTICNVALGRKTPQRKNQQMFDLFPKHMLWQDIVLLPGNNFFTKNRRQTQHRAVAGLHVSFVCDDFEKHIQGVLPPQRCQPTTPPADRDLSRKRGRRSKTVFTVQKKKDSTCNRSAERKTLVQTHE